MTEEILIRNSINPIGFGDSLTAEINKSFIMEVDGAWVGTVQLSEYPELEDFDWMFISSLIVDDQFRRRGYGTALMKKAMSEAESNGKGSYLMVYQDNDGAIKLYEKLGFRIVREYYYDNDPNGFYVMAIGFGSTNQLMEISFDA